MTRLVDKFNTPYLDVPTAWLDFESTGMRPGVDAACQVGIAIFEQGKCVAQVGSLINPGMLIPESATAIHGITDEMVDDAPTLRDFFERPDIIRLVDGCQPAAYNAPFDRCFAPAWLFDMSWPWLDALVAVRVVDRYAKGSGRHKLPAVCERHGIHIPHAHHAEHDARAAGEVFYKLMPHALADRDYLENDGDSLGAVLHWTRQQEANAWRDFNSWLSRQPPRET